MVKVSLAKRRFIILIGLLFALSVHAQEVKKCLICHGKPGLKKVLASGKVISLYVDESVLAGSVHANRRCEECHRDIVEIPHRGQVKKVDCTHCHYEGNPVGAPQTKAYRYYQDSVHGRAAAAGNPKAPVCQDCHGNHNVRKVNDPDSKVYPVHIPETCGACHLSIYAEYATSIHGQALRDGNLDTPSCTSCHGEHRILSPENPASPVYGTNIPKTCPKCHAAVGLMSKYGIETTPVETYQESYHGVASKFGMRTVANCASCHGVHDIRAPEDPRSSVNLANIPKTCGQAKCHPGANINFAKGKIHVEPRDPRSGVLYWVSTFFKWLTITVMVGLVIHIALDLNRKFRHRRAAETK